jgi:hypothetical protein
MIDPVHRNPGYVVMTGLADIGTVDMRRQIFTGFNNPIVTAHAGSRDTCMSKGNV